MRKSTFAWLFLCALLLAACTADERTGLPQESPRGLTFRLGEAGYENGAKSRSADEAPRYDLLEHCIVDEEGRVVKGIKTAYLAQTAQIVAEGLRQGDYTLLVLAAKGDTGADGAEVHPITSSRDTWLTFPASLGKPLSAEYFHAAVPFSVRTQQGADGEEETASTGPEIRLKRFVGRVDFSFAYHNKYVRTAVTSCKLALHSPRFCTTLKADGTLGGETDGTMAVLDLGASPSYVFMPSATGHGLEGSITLATRSYEGGTDEQQYEFSHPGTEPNKISRVDTEVTHPDDETGTIFMTPLAYAEGNYPKILQDGEPRTIYEDEKQRMFNTARPLQIEMTDEGKLHVRFYSPRPLPDVKVKALFPATGSEYIDLAYFDTIPAFAEFREELPAMQRRSVYRTESGRRVELPQLKADDLKGATFKVESGDPYWQMLCDIKCGWDICFISRDGSDPDAEDGRGPGAWGDSWTGIRPVHCREYVAVFLNYAYMASMPDVEDLLKANPDKLYDDKKNPVPPETVIQQMRAPRKVVAGLVWGHSGAEGFAGGTNYGVKQRILLQHYWNSGAPMIFLHEIGHLLGYGHTSAFTYGPWAEKLLNYFYIDNIARLPIGSESYLNSKNNPNLYEK